MSTNQYTVTVYKKDKRVSAGRRKVGDFDHEGLTLEQIRALYDRKYKDGKHEISINETYVQRVNLMTKLPYMERFDTPVYMSPAFESFWSM